VSRWARFTDRLHSFSKCAERHKWRIFVRREPRGRWRLPASSRDHFRFPERLSRTYGNFRQIVCSEAFANWNVHISLRTRGGNLSASLRSDLRTSKRLEIYICYRCYTHKYIFSQSIKKCLWIFLQDTVWDYSFYYTFFFTVQWLRFEFQVKNTHLHIFLIYINEIY